MMQSVGEKLKFVVVRDGSSGGAVYETEKYFIKGNLAQPLCPRS
jgi:hypothetical protein